MDISIVEGTYLRSAGAANAPLLFLVHAFAETSFCYRQLAECGLDQRFRLVAPDLWGFGATPRDPQVRTVDDYARALARLIRTFAQERPVGIVAHSIAAAIAVGVVDELAGQVSGLFSIEGNLTADDAMFTGRAAQFDDADAFKASFLEAIWQMGRTMPALRHYYASAHIADARAMWHLGRDAVEVSKNNRLGEAFKTAPCPSRYYWSKQTTPAATQKWIYASGIDHEEYADAGHWPMIERPSATAEAIHTFFAAVDGRR